MKSELEIVGWREWIALPDLGVDRIKVKVDSGARTSALHAENIRLVTSGARPEVHFTIFPLQRSKQGPINAVGHLIDERHVKSSIGHKTFRPVITTELALGQARFPIELTLVNRDILGFRMLLGREALRGRYLINPGRSYLIGKKPQNTEERAV